MLRNLIFDPLLLMCHALSVLNTFRILSAIVDSKISVSNLNLYQCVQATSDILTMLIIKYLGKLQADF